jgi:regulator of protease activity HflC (stomatin/prohibitin superfamily)
MRFFSKTTVYEGSAALHFKDGKLTEVLGPGVYRYLFGNHRLTVVNLLPTYGVVGGQEVTTSDGGSLRVSLLLTQQIEDPELHYRSGQIGSSSFEEINPFGADFGVAKNSSFHLAAQVALREWISARKMVEVVEQRTTIAEAISPVIVGVAQSAGVHISNVELLEFNVVGGLKAAYADLLKAEIEGQAALTRARNESTTMRSLLNTARLVREHPGLLELRVLSAGQKPRVTFVVNNPVGNDKVVASDGADISD